MALIWDIESDETLDVKDFIEHVQETAVPGDLDSLAACVPKFRALANNRTFVLDAFHGELKAFWEGDRRNADQPQSVQIANTPDFYIRANIWLPIPAGARTEKFQKRLYSYEMPHDHNFSFLTVGYFGPGYQTDIYEYEWKDCVGFMGEKANCRHLGRVQLHPGRVMLYREGKDIHIQYAPEEVSVSVNLMGRNNDVRWDQQYIFDVERDQLIGGAGDLVSNRLFLVEVAEHIGDDETVGILHDLVKDYPCPKTKARSIQSLDRLAPEEGERARSNASANVRELAALHLITGNWARSYSGA
jgi:hypothetical protein